MSRSSTERPRRVKPWRRAVQLLVLAVLIYVPWQAQNPMDNAFSRIVLGQLPEPVVAEVTGDTWSFSVGDFNLTHPVAFFEATLGSKKIYLPLLISALLPLAITVLLGRVFCSWLCPVGFFLELNMKLSRLTKKAGLFYTGRLVDYRYLLLTISMIFAFLFAMPLISVFDPPHVLGREIKYAFVYHQLSLSGLGLLFGLWLVDLFIAKRGCCGKLCPSGGALALLGRKRLLRISMDKQRCVACGECDRVCPFDLEPMNLAAEGDFDWSMCDNCGLCRDQCPYGAICYRFKV